MIVKVGRMTLSLYLLMLKGNANLNGQRHKYKELLKKTKLQKEEMIIDFQIK